VGWSPPSLFFGDQNPQIVQATLITYNMHPEMHPMALMISTVSLIHVISFYLSMHHVCTEIACCAIDSSIFKANLSVRGTKPGK
jgi:hypothetical protein